MKDTSQTQHPLLTDPYTIEVVTAQGALVVGVVDAFLIFKALHSGIAAARLLTITSAIGIIDADETGGTFNSRVVAASEANRCWFTYTGTCTIVWSGTFFKKTGLVIGAWESFGASAHALASTATKPIAIGGIAFIVGVVNTCEPCRALASCIAATEKRRILFLLTNANAVGSTVDGIAIVKRVVVAKESVGALLSCQASTFRDAISATVECVVQLAPAVGVVSASKPVGARISNKASAVDWLFW